MKFEVKMSSVEVAKLMNMVESIGQLYGVNIDGDEIVDVIHKGLDRVHADRGIEFPGCKITAKVGNRHYPELEVKGESETGDYVAMLDFFLEIFNELKPYATLIRAAIEMARNSGQHLANIGQKLAERYERPSTYGIVRIDRWNEVGTMAVAIIENNGYYTHACYTNCIGKQYDDLIDDIVQDAIEKDEVEWMIDAETGDKLKDCYAEASMAADKAMGEMKAQYTKHHFIVFEYDDGNVFAINASVEPDCAAVASREVTVHLAGDGTEYPPLTIAVPLESKHITAVKTAEGPLKEGEWEKWLAAQEKRFGTRSKAGARAKKGETACTNESEE